MVATPRAEENALTASALDGDEQALGRLLAIHQQATYNLAYRVLGSEADARDAVQEAYLLAVRAIRGDRTRPRDVDRFRGWLRRVVTNAALGQLRRRPSFAPVSVDDMADALPAPERVEPARQVERRETRGDILRALLGLPDGQRAALTLRDSEGFSYDEIAAILGISRGAVETLLFRARRNFRAAYEGLAATSEPFGCAELAQLLSVRLDDELSAVAWQDLQAHLEGCPSCRQEIDGLRRSQRLHALVPLLALPAGWDPIASALGATGVGLTGATATAGQASRGATDVGAGMTGSAGGPAASIGPGGGRHAGERRRSRVHGRWRLGDRRGGAGRSGGEAGRAVGGQGGRDRRGGWHRGGDHRGPTRDERRAPNRRGADRHRDDRFDTRGRRVTGRAGRGRVAGRIGRGRVADAGTPEPTTTPALAPALASTPATTGSPTLTR